MCMDLLNNSFMVLLINLCIHYIVGSGSYGNGGAMRIAPAALYGNSNDDLLIKVNGVIKLFK